MSTTEFFMPGVTLVAPGRELQAVKKTSTITTTQPTTPQGSTQGALTTTTIDIPMVTSFLPHTPPTDTITSTTTPLISTSSATVYISTASLSNTQTTRTLRTTSSHTNSTVTATGSITSETLTTATTTKTWAPTTTETVTVSGTHTPSTTSVTQTISTTTSSLTPTTVTTTLTTTNTTSTDGRIGITTYTNTTTSTSATGTTHSETSTTTNTTFNSSPTWTTTTSPTLTTTSPTTTGTFTVTVKEVSNSTTGTTTQTITIKPTTSTSTLTETSYTRDFSSSETSSTSPAFSTTTLTSSTPTTTSSLALTSRTQTKSFADDTSFSAVTQTNTPSSSTATSTTFVANKTTSNTETVGTTTTLTTTFVGDFTSTNTTAGFITTSTDTQLKTPSNPEASYSITPTTTLTTIASNLPTSLTTAYSIDAPTTVQPLGQSDVNGTTTTKTEHELVVTKSDSSGFSFDDLSLETKFTIGFGALGVLSFLASICVFMYRRSRYLEHTRDFQQYQLSTAPSIALNTALKEIKENVTPDQIQNYLARAQSHDDLLARLNTAQHINNVAHNVGTGVEQLIRQFNEHHPGYTVNWNDGVAEVRDVHNALVPHPQNIPAVPSIYQPPPPLPPPAAGPAVTLAEILLDAAERGEDDNPLPGHPLALPLPLVGGGILPANDLGPIPLRRMKDHPDGEYTVINSLLDKLCEAQDMLFVNPDKEALLNGISFDLSVLLKSPTLSAADKQTIEKELIPQLRSEYLSIFAYNVDALGLDNYVASSTLAVDVSNINTWINRNHWQTTPYSSNGGSFFDASKNIIYSQNSAARTRFVSLVGEDTQYTEIGGAIDIVSLSPEAGRKYNISTGDGDDVVMVDFSLNSDRNTAVNLLGGNGRDTYIIKIKNGLSQLPGKITIWDFDPNEDKVIFDAGPDNYLRPNIKQTWSGSIFAPALAQYNPDGTVRLYSQTPSWQDFWRGNTGRLDTLEGTGIPMVEMWSERRWGQGANIFAQGNFIKTTASASELDSGVGTRALLIPTNTYQSTYSQFENTHDVDCFAVGLLAGSYYRFRIQAAPGVSYVVSEGADGAVSKTQLYVTKKEGSQETLVNTYATTQDAHYFQIDFLAQSGGLHYLHAYSDRETPVGSYEIQYREASAKTDLSALGTPIVEGKFNGRDDFQVFTANLSAGQYVSLTDYGDRASISVFDPQGVKINAWLNPSQNDNYKFLANTAGKYSFVAEDKVKILPEQDFKIEFRSNLEIEGGIGTQADLINAANANIKNTLEHRRDRDWFRVDLRAGQTYQFDLNKAAGTNLDTYIWLRDKNGVGLGADRWGRVAFDDDGGATHESWYDSRLVYQIASSGTYYIDVGSWQGRSSGDYALACKVI